MDLDVCRNLPPLSFSDASSRVTFSGLNSVLVSTATLRLFFFFSFLVSSRPQHPIIKHLWMKESIVCSTPAGALCLFTALGVKLCSQLLPLSRDIQTDKLSAPLIFDFLLFFFYLDYKPDGTPLIPRPPSLINAPLACGKDWTVAHVVHTYECEQSLTSVGTNAGGVTADTEAVGRNRRWTGFWKLPVFTPAADQICSCSGVSVIISNRSSWPASHSSVVFQISHLSSDDQLCFPQKFKPRRRN